MKILLIDDHALLRQGLATLLAKEDETVEVREAASIETAIEAAAEGPFDVVVTDLELGNSSGLEVLKWFGEHDQRLPMVVLSMHEDYEHLLAAFRAGARAYVAKSSDTAEIRAAIATVVRGGLYLDQTMLSLLVSRATGLAAKPEIKNDDSYDNLTEREREVFVQLARNASIEEIGEVLGISPKTVENHRGAIYSKLGLSDRLSLYHYARRLGLGN